MCGRYTLRDPQVVEAALARLGVKRQSQQPLPLRYNVAPTQTMPAVKGGTDWTLEGLRWGHLVKFGPEAKPQLMINARSETAAVKTTFKKGIQERRCVLPADGFFEWQRSQGGKVKVPFYIRRKDSQPFWIAGIFWPADEEQPDRYIVLTTAPNELMTPIHDRMPVMFDDQAAKEWLTPGPMTPVHVQAFCASYPTIMMVADVVSPLVNSARNDGPECVEAPTPPTQKPKPSTSQQDLFPDLD